MEDVDWKTVMFHSEAELFSKTLRAKPISNSLSQLLATLRQRVLPQNRFATLDLGCGTGRLSPQLANSSSIVIGLDRSNELLRIAASEQNHLPNVIFLNGDFRNVDSLFSPNSFDLIIRAYTSLGYFPYAVELEILRKCHPIASRHAMIVLDTFNSAFFRSRSTVERKTAIESNASSLTLTETYTWAEEKNGINCIWTYSEEDVQTCKIEFFLDGYDYSRVSELLLSSGWTLLMSGCDFDRISDQTNTTLDGERLVVVASKVA
jgi:SAM-dependent methyltransferase